jgi:hypothetical protein
MRRIVLVLSAAALVAAITAFSSVSAFAQEEPVCTEEPPGIGGMGIWTVTCVGTEVRSEEVSRTPTTEACQLGNSPRQGTQEGELVQTDEVTYQVTTTTYYQGNPSNNQLADVDPNPLIEEVELSRVEGEPTFEPTGRCRPVPGRPA